MTPDDVDQVDEETGPLDVSQELVAETDPLVGSLDEPGDVSGHKGVLVSHLDYS